MTKKYLEVAATPAVLKAEEQYYGRSKPAAATSAVDLLGLHEREFVAARDSFYMATVSESGWPYVQHRGGAPGFLRVLDDSTLGFADYRGNHQLISTGNLAAHDRVALFLMDYPGRRRLKILGHARVEDARARPDMVANLASPEMRPLVERLFFVDIVAFDWNCPQYITQRFTAAEIEAAVLPLRQQIAALQAQLERTTAEGLPARAT